jgi:hypothetical protein
VTGGFLNIDEPASEIETGIGAKEGSETGLCIFDISVGREELEMPGSALGTGLGMTTSGMFRTLGFSTVYFLVRFTIFNAATGTIGVGAIGVGNAVGIIVLLLDEATAGTELDDLVEGGERTEARDTQGGSVHDIVVMPAVWRESEDVPFGKKNEVGGNILAAIRYQEMQGRGHRNTTYSSHWVESCSA